MTDKLSNKLERTEKEINELRNLDNLIYLFNTHKITGIQFEDLNTPAPPIIFNTLDIVTSNEIYEQLTPLRKYAITRCKLLTDLYEK